MKTTQFTRSILLVAWSVAIFMTVVMNGSVHAQSLASSTTEVPVTLQPADSHGNTAGKPGYFIAEALPGQKVRLFALVGNVGHKRARVSIVPVDATSGLFGGITYNLPEQKRTLVGRWVHVAFSRVSLAPGRGAVVPFSVRVPAGTAPGQYIGGLTAFVPAPKLKKTRGIAAIRVQIRAVTAIVITVPGPMHSRFSLGRVHAQQRPDGVYAVVTIKNSGNTLLYGQGNLWVMRPGTHGPVLRAHLVIGITVPHTVVNYPVLWARQPKPGHYYAHVVLWWNGGYTARYVWFWVRTPHSTHKNG
jgi:hypothetical protein